MGTLVLFRFPSEADENFITSLISSIEIAGKQTLRTRKIPGRGGRPNRGNELYLFLLVPHGRTSEAFKNTLNQLKSTISLAYPDAAKEVRISKNKVAHLPRNIKHGEMGMNVEMSNIPAARVTAVAAAVENNNSHNRSLNLGDLTNIFGRLSTGYNDDEIALADAMKKLGFGGGARISKTKKQRKNKKSTRKH